MSRATQRLLDHQPLVVEAHSRGEWIVGAPAGGRRLHIYRVAANDWLVSEVGRRNEGRGVDLARALASLAAGGAWRGWWRLVPAALEDMIKR